MSHSKNLSMVIENQEKTIKAQSQDLRSLHEVHKDLEGVIGEKEAVVNNIYNSHGWKALSVYYKFKDKVLTIISKMRALAEIVFRWLNLVSIENIGKGLTYIKLRGYKACYRKIKETFGIGDSKKLICEKKIETPPKSIPYESYVKNNEIQPHIRKLLVNASKQFKYKPLISIIMPVYNVDPQWLKAALDSVLDQIYENWELCIADDASTNKATLEFLKIYKTIDKRIKVMYREKNGHICAASNSAAELAQGEFVAFMDNDDLLAPNALFEIVRTLQGDSRYDLIYSDEDKIDEHDKRYDPQFKPDWSPELLLSYNYINHFTCIRRTLFEAVGRFRIGFEGAQDFDLLLRVMERTDQVGHIPKVLYHWRAVKGSVALDARYKTIMITTIFPM